MGTLLNFMGHLHFFTVLALVLLLIPASAQLESNEEGYISLLLSNEGVDFAKDVLIDKAVSSLVPLRISDIEKSMKIPLIGKVRMVLSDITIYSVNIGSSYIETEDEGIVLVASSATANLALKWKYSYSTWIVEVSDSGDASVQVKGMEVGVSAVLKEQDGALRISLSDCGCHVKDISIKLDGGASWLYQGLVDAFEGPIGSAVQDAISGKIKQGIVKLDSLLQSLPRQIPVDNVAALNVTFVKSPALSNSSVEFEINGLFVGANNISVPDYYYKEHQTSVSCKNPAKMIGISLHEHVFNTAAALYFNAGYMHWVIDEFLNETLFNTAAWRFIYPQLYEQYPNDDMNLDITVTSPPFIRVLDNDIAATIYLDVIVNVLDAGEVIPVACVSLVLNTSISPKILRNRVGGFVKMKHLTVTFKWSTIGNLHMPLLQSIMYTFVRIVFIPYLNSHLLRGLPLPLLQGFTLRNAEIGYIDSKIIVCSNLAFMQ